MFESLRIDPRAADALQNGVRQRRLPHAVLLEGADSETRFQAAKELAQAIVCTKSEPPCGLCRACRKALANSHPDIHFLQKEDGDAFIKVDAVRALKAQAMLLPNDGERCVFVISEAQDMNVQAQNALLKILEEPAPHVCFLLTCESSGALLETIRSRASLYTLQSADLSSGGQSEQAAQTAKAFLGALVDGNELDLLRESAVLLKDKTLFQDMMAQLQLLLRDALVADCGIAPLGEEEALSKKLRMRLTKDKLLRMIEEAAAFSQASKANANQNLTVTALCSSFAVILLEP